MRRPLLTTALILAWADDYHRRTGTWPTVKSGRVRYTRGETWRRVNNALCYGLRGMPGGSSLARFLAEHRGVRNRTNLPCLSVRLILSWADLHHERTGEWPTMDTGRVTDAPEETWHGIDEALKGGLRGLSGGDSLARLLVRRRGARNHTNIPRLNVRKILSWADAYHERTGQWPNQLSGAIPESPGDNWAAINAALRLGLRGLAGGTTLYRLLRKHRQIEGHRPAVCPSKVKGPGRGWPQIRINFPEEVLDRCRSGELDRQAVAEMCGVSMPVARRELRRAGVRIRAGRPPGGRPALHAKVVRRCRRGQSLARIAAAVGLSRERVATILRRYGIAPRSKGINLFMPGTKRKDRQRLGARLKELRSAAGLTQNELAERARLTQVTISALENGRTCPTRKTMKAVARVLKIEVGELMAGC